MKRKLGMCLTQVGTVWQRFVWLAHWRLRPASSSGTKASRAVQGDRPIGVYLRTFPGINASTGVGFNAPDHRDLALSKRLWGTALPGLLP